MTDSDSEYGMMSVSRATRVMLEMVLRVPELAVDSPTYTHILHIAAHDQQKVYINSSRR